MVLVPIYLYIYIHINIYICKYREREREKDKSHESSLEIKKLVGINWGMIPRRASGDEHVPGKEFGALHGRRLASFEVGIHNIPGNLRVQYSSSCVFPPILWWDFGSFIRERDLMRDTIATDIVVPP